MFEIKEYEKKYNKKINDFVISIYVDEYGFEEHRLGIEKKTMVSMQRMVVIFGLLLMKMTKLLEPLLYINIVKRIWN